MMAQAAEEAGKEEGGQIAGAVSSGVYPEHLSESVVNPGLKAGCSLVASPPHLIILSHLASHHRRRLLPRASVRQPLQPSGRGHCGPGRWGHAPVVV
jgi:hypothetical protein